MLNVIYSAGLSASSLVFILLYVLQAWALYTMAKRRGVHYYGLAWVPVANLWLIGTLADQYNAVARGKTTRMRRTLLGLAIATAAVEVMMIAVMIVALLPMLIALITSLSAPYDNTAIAMTMTWAVGLVLLGFATTVLSVILMVFEYIALYRIFASCDPNNATLFLILSILFMVTLPFFLFVCRNKDWGMVPQRPVYVQPPIYQAPPTDNGPY